MEVMPAKDIVLALIPETVSVIAFILIVLKGNDAFKSINWFNCIVSIVFISFMIFLTRSKLDNIVLIILFSAGWYALSFKILFYKNIRISILSGMLALFLLVFLESIFLPIILQIIYSYIPADKLNEYFKAHSYFDFRVLLSTISRLIQMLFMIVTYKRNLKIENYVLFRKNWDELTDGSKFTVSTLLTFLLCSLTIDSMFLEIFTKQQLSKNVSISLVDLTVIFMITIYFMISTISVLKRSIENETRLEILEMSPDEHFEELLRISNPEDIESYKQTLEAHLNKYYKGGDINEKTKT